MRYFIGMACLAMVCALLAGNYWVLLTVTLIQAATWLACKRDDHRSPFSGRWGRALEQIALWGAIIGMMASMRHSVGHGRGFGVNFHAALTHLLLICSMYVSLDFAWYRSSKERQGEKKLLRRGWVALSITLAASFWIRHL
jgi:hypothetical protein